MSEAVSDRTTNPDNGQDKGNALVRIRSVIVQDLTKEERLLLLLWHAEAMTPNEIGLILHTSAAQIRTMHDRAINRLRTLAGLHQAATVVC